MEPRPDDALPEPQQQGQNDRRLDRGDPKVLPEIVGRRGERRQDDEQRHDRDVLEQQDPHDLASVDRAEFEPLGKHLPEDRGGTHGDGAAEGDPGLPPEPREQRDGHHEPHRQQHLQSAETKHEMTHRDELRETELQADREHQEDDAELGEMARALVVGQPGGGVGSDGDADEQVADERRQLQQAAQDDHRDSGGEQDQGCVEGRVHTRPNLSRARSETTARIVP